MGSRDADYEEFLALRKHVRKLQQGTPLLLNSLGGEDNPQIYQICAFQVSQDLQTLTWRECEGTGSSKRLPLSAIGAIKEINLPRNGSGGEAHFALQVRLREDVPNVPRTFELICTSQEDLEAWHQGLRFLTGDNGEERPKATGGSPSSEAQKLQVQQELNERLMRENEMLRAMLQRKDATIAELLRDSKSIKTESTSRESDEHLQFREVAILRRKNKRLQNELKSKQHTISGLLKLVERLSQQADETSAQETAEEEPEINPKQVIETKADSVPPRAAPAASRAAPAASRAAPAVPRAAAAVPAAPPVEEENEKDDDVGIFGGELAALADKLQMLERVAAAATQGVAAVSSFQPPPRNGGTAGRGPKSARALEALQKEFDLLEEKKRLVQHLAHTLEPVPSDSEDDGFPLR